MGILDLFKKKKTPGLGVDELARRLDVGPVELRSFEPRYDAFTVPKRDGSRRRILAPDNQTKLLQRRIHRRLLALLVAHPAANGFERGRSIVTNARLHVGRAVIVRLDIRDFFTNTTANRVQDFFRHFGWDKEAANLLTRLCTHDGGLPQGAPTSPRLANLVNYKFDTRMDHMATRAGSLYSRYADDLTFSFEVDAGARVRTVIRHARAIARDLGYTIHKRRKVHVRRRHQQQLVTGLVVNETINLPRDTRRWLRAVEHHVATGRPITLTDAQLRGWRALQTMIGPGRAGG